MKIVDGRKEIHYVITRIKDKIEGGVQYITIIYGRKDRYQRDITGESDS